MAITRIDITEKVRVATEEAARAAEEAEQAEAEANAAMAEVARLSAAASERRARAQAERAVADQAKATATALTADLRCACGNRRLAPTVVLGPDGNPTVDGEDVFSCPACGRVHQLDTTGDTVKLRTVVNQSSLAGWRSL